jgi:hypothetical protein
MPDSIVRTAQARIEAAVLQILHTPAMPCLWPRWPCTFDGPSVRRRFSGEPESTVYNLSPLKLPSDCSTRHRNAGRLWPKSESTKWFLRQEWSDRGGAPQPSEISAVDGCQPVGGKRRTKSCPFSILRRTDWKFHRQLRSPVRAAGFSIRVIWGKMSAGNSAHTLELPRNQFIRNVLSG